MGHQRERYTPYYRSPDRSFHGLPAVSARPQKSKLWPADCNVSRKRRAVLGSTVHTMAPPRRPPKDLGPLTPTALRDYVRFNGGKPSS